MTPARKPGVPAAVLVWALASAVVWTGLALLLLGWLPR